MRARGCGAVGEVVAVPSPLESMQVVDSIAHRTPVVALRLVHPGCRQTTDLRPWLVHFVASRLGGVGEPGGEVLADVAVVD